MDPRGDRRSCKKNFRVILTLIITFLFIFLKYLSTADERLQWQANSLPADDLCTENAIMLKRFNRYPLIIDPSGQATEFLLNEYKGRKINKTRYSPLKTEIKLLQSRGPFLKKSRKLFGPEKSFKKLRPANSVKLVFSNVVKGIKIKTTAKFRASRRLRYEDTRRIMSPEMRPKSFGAFEKRAPALSC